MVIHRYTIHLNSRDIYLNIKATVAGMQQGIVWPHGMMTAPALINGAMLNHVPNAMMQQGN